MPNNGNLYSENVAQLGIVYFNYMIAISIENIIFKYVYETSILFEGQIGIILARSEIGSMRKTSQPKSS